jgi:hypothetical protein
MGQMCSPGRHVVKGAGLRIYERRRFFNLRTPNDDEGPVFEVFCPQKRPKMPEKKMVEGKIPPQNGGFAQRKVPKLRSNAA